MNNAKLFVLAVFREGDVGSTLARRRHQCFKVLDLKKNNEGEEQKKLQPLLPAFEEGPLQHEQRHEFETKNHSRKKHTVLSKSPQPAGPGFSLEINRLLPRLFSSLTTLLSSLSQPLQGERIFQMLRTL